LTSTISYTAKIGQAGTNWSISDNAAVWLAVMDLVQTALDARDEVVMAQTDFADQLDTLQTLIDGLSAGAVVSVNGLTGVAVVGVGDIPAKGIYGSLASELAAKASITYVNTQVSAKQDSSAKTSAIAALTWAADNLIYLTGTATAALTPISAFTRGVLNSTDGAAWRSALGITAPTPATDAEIRAGTGTGPIVSGSITSSSVPVTMTDATTITFDWAAGINREVTLAGNRTLGNPSNSIPGTTRTVYVVGNSSTVRTLLFGTNYKGTPPSLADITNTQGYLLTIYCRSSTHFVVSAVEAL
jgi:hypothetical protein